LVLGDGNEDDTASGSAVGGIGSFPQLQLCQDGGRKDGSGLERRFIVFDAAPENERDRGMQARKMNTMPYFV